MFDTVVSLYKEAGCPKLEQGGSFFSYSGMPSGALQKAIAEARLLSDSFGSFLEEEESGGIVDFKWSLAESDSGRIYEDVSDFVARTPSLSRGEAPYDYYIASIDYRAGGSTIDEELKQVQLCCQLIKLLASLSGHHVRDTIVGSAAVLTFIAPADAGKAPKTIRLTTHVSVGVLKIPSPDLTALQGVLSEDVKHQLHIEERKSLFRIAVAEVLRDGKQGKEAYEGLINNWSDVLAKYRNDLDCFIHGFSFDKLRREIAATELDYTSRLGNVLKDFSGKLYGLPISFAAIIPLSSPKTLVEGLLIISGMVLLSLIISSVVHNLRIEMERIRHSYGIVFNQFNNKMIEYPPELKNALEAAKNGIEKQRGLLSRTLIISYLLSWIPPVAGILVLASTYP